MRSDDGWCQLRNDTPALYPSSLTASVEPSSQNPKPYRSAESDTMLWGRTISATHSGGHEAAGKQR